MNSSKQVVGETRAGLIYGVFDFYAVQHVQYLERKYESRI